MGPTDEPSPAHRVINHPANWVAAPWAVTCGALAGAGLSGRSLGIGGWLLACLLSVVASGAIWEALVRVDWPAVGRDWRRAAHVPVPAIHLPYLSRSAPWRRLVSAWAGLSWWIRESLRPLAGSSVVTVALMVPLILLVASGVGGEVLWVTVGLVVYALVAGVAASGSMSSLWSVPLVIAGSWLLGQSAAGPLSWRGGVVAALAAIAFIGLEIAQRRRGLLASDIAGALLVALLVWQRSTVAACITGAILLMSVAMRSAAVPTQALVRWSRPLWLAMILAASVGIHGA